MDSLRQQLIESIRELSDLLVVIFDKEQEEAIQEHLDQLNLLLDKIVEESINRESEAFGAAIEALKSATGKVREARKDIDRVADAIGYIASAAKAVAKVLKATA